MRTSCNGCRVLRKGCGEDCSIKACLEWIRSPDSQANATVFLAKFYGRAGLMNLINAGPHQIRPAIFKSLLYDACGRIVSPIFGSVGLISSGNWQLCQDAVEAVLRGDPMTRTGAEFAEAKNGRPLEAGDIRHVNNGCTVHGSNDVHRVRNRFRFRRSSSKPKRRRVCVEENAANEKECNRSPSHDSSISQQSDMAGPDVEEPTSEAQCSPSSNSDNEIELDLTLSLKPTKATGARKMDQRLDCSVS